MSKDNRQATECLDIALERIAAEKTARTGRLYLVNLGLTRPPPELSELDWLEVLSLGKIHELLLYGIIYRRSDAGYWEKTDETPNPNHIEPIAAWLRGLPRLRSLDCSATDLQDLTPLADLSALQSLDCRNTQVANLAPLANLPSLQALDCGRTQVADLTPLTELSELQFLHCGETQVVDLMPLAGCSALRSLDCLDTQVADLTPLADLSMLQALGCMGTKVTDLTPLARLSILRFLDCRHNQISDLTPLADLSVLQALGCGSTQVADLTPLANCSALESLYCGYTPVSDLTPLAGCSALQFLDCEKTQVTDLAPLAGCTALRSLDCKGTQVADLKPLADCSALQSLDCEKTQVTDLAPLAGCTALRSLDCKGTQVADLDPLAGCSMLESLRCRGTQVADLSPLANCSALRELHCWETPVSDLPRSVIGLPDLEELIIQAQPGLGDIPAEVLSQDQRDNCLSRLRAHLADLDAGAEPLRDLKVIVLGNGRIGKTQLCRRLRREAFEADADSTHGISVTSVGLAMSGDVEDTVLNLWDFGGQDIYHGTHALFMRTRAIFLLLWTPDSEQGNHEHGGMVFRNRPLPYWLEYIRHLGGDRSPVILVQNQCDGGLGERPHLPVDEELLSPLLEDGRLFTRVAYSTKDKTGHPRLLDALQQAVRQLREFQGQPMIGRNRLAVWNQLRFWRDADARKTDEAHRQHRLLPYREFEALCREHGVRGADGFAEVLHHAGMVYYQPYLFDNQLVLDQSWALDAVYALFTREGDVYKNLSHFSGRFTHSLLDALLWGKRGLSRDDQESLLGMMETSGICFVHRYADLDGETEYVAPDLLPEGPEALADEIAGRWDLLPDEPLEANFVYPFLSPAIARSVLSAFGRLAGATALYWRYGLCLYDGASRATAIIEELPDAEGYGGQVRVRAKGEGAATLLARLVERIKKLDEHSGWSGRLLETPPAEDVAKGIDLRPLIPSPPFDPLSPTPLPAGEGLLRHPPAGGIDPDPEQIRPATPPPIPPDKPEIYVSYAWKREHQDPLVTELCAELEKQGLHIRRDSTDLQPGDRISHYMERLSQGRCVVVILSRDYLRSEYCMTELYRLYTNAQQRDKDFLRRTVPLIQDDARIATPRERIAHAVYWKTEYDELATLVREHGPGIMGAEDFRRFKLIGEFYHHVGDMLVYANDVPIPQDRLALSKDNFALVKGLIDRALA